MAVAKTPVFRPVRKSLSSKLRWKISSSAADYQLGYTNRKSKRKYVI